MLSVGGGDRVLLQENADATNVGKMITVAVSVDGETLQVNVIGIPGAGAVRIPVDATFGGVNLKTAYIVRVGPAAMIEAGLYNHDSACVDQGTDADLDAAAAMANDVFDPTDDDCETDMRFGRGEKFVINVAINDALGSETEDEVEMTLPDVDDLLEDVVLYGAVVGGPSATETFGVYEVGSKAPYGMHTITLAFDDNDDDDDNDLADVELTFYRCRPAG